MIGEAANRLRQLKPSLEEARPELWAGLGDAYDMRIILTHEYFRVQPSIVWDTVDNHLDSLLGLLTEFASNQN